MGILTSLNYPSQPQAIRSTRVLIQCFFSLYPQFRMTAQPQPPIPLSLVHDSIHQPLMSSFSETDYLQFLASRCGAQAKDPYSSMTLFSISFYLSINLAWRARQATISSKHSLLTLLGTRKPHCLYQGARASDCARQPQEDRLIYFYHTLFHHTPPDCLFKDHHDMSLVSHTPRDIHVPILTADQIMAGANPTTRPISVVLLQRLSTAQPG